MCFVLACTPPLKPVDLLNQLFELAEAQLAKQGTSPTVLFYCRSLKCLRRKTATRVLARAQRGVTSTWSGHPQALKSVYSVVCTLCRLMYGAAVHYHACASL